MDMKRHINICLFTSMLSILICLITYLFQAWRMELNVGFRRSKCIQLFRIFCGLLWGSWSARTIMCFWSFSKVQFLQRKIVTLIGGSTSAASCMGVESRVDHAAVVLSNSYKHWGSDHRRCLHVRAPQLWATKCVVQFHYFKIDNLIIRFLWNARIEQGICSFLETNSMLLPCSFCRLNCAGMVLLKFLQYLVILTRGKWAFVQRWHQLGC